VSAGWVAGSVRARGLAKRRIGAEAARQLASCGSLAEALAQLAATPYGGGRDGGGVFGGTLGGGSAGAGSAVGGPLGGASFGGGAAAGWADPDEPGGAGMPGAVAAAQHAVAATLLWDLRVLAGWLPQGSAQLMRTLAGWFEIANVAERLRELAGQQAGDLFTLGAVATAWPQLRRAASLADLRAALAASAWQDPGDQTAAAIQVGMRVRWAQRVATLGEPARTWAASALALLLAGERFAAGRPDQPVLRSVAARLLGPAAAAAGTMEELVSSLPGRLSWVLEPASTPADLWLAEAAWWARVERDGHGLLAGSGFDQGPVIGATAVLAADARRVCAALEVAARGGGPIEVFDAVA